MAILEKAGLDAGPPPGARGSLFRDPLFTIAHSLPVPLSQIPRRLLKNGR